MRQTRIERIRTMSDEELAKFLLDINDSCPSFCKFKDTNKCKCPEKCIEGILAYLQKQGNPQDYLRPWYFWKQIKHN